MLRTSGLGDGKDSVRGAGDGVPESALGVCGLDVGGLHSSRYIVCVPRQRPLIGLLVVPDPHPVTTHKKNNKMNNIFLFTDFITDSAVKDSINGTKLLVKIYHFQVMISKSDSVI
jgi:hypothetical protein